MSEDDEKPRKWDPDRMTFEDLDLSDMEAIDEYLNDPVTNALMEDLGRQFRREPAEVQTPELEESLTNQRERLAELVETIAKPGWSPEVLTSFEELKVAIETSIHNAEQRIIVLKLDGPDE